jgi:biopolymer transport protein ExbB
LPASISHAQTTPNETTAPAPVTPAPAQAAAPTMSRPAAPATSPVTPPAEAVSPAVPAQSAVPATQPVTPAATPNVAPAITPATVPAEPAAAATPPAQPPMAVEAPAEEPADLLSQLLNPPPRSDLPHDLSPWGMFMGADWVVKAVMLGLAFASLVTWTVWISKSIELAGARNRATRALKIIRQSKTLAEAVEGIEGRGGPGALMLRTAAEESALSEEAIDHAGGGGLKERVSSSLSRIEAYAGRRMARGTGVLATIGSTSPLSACSAPSGAS